MAEERVQRHLAAILAADVVGYSRIMGEDEAGTLARLKQLRHDVFDPNTEKFGGRLFKTTGDGLLIEFPSAVDAVNHAVAVQRALGEANADVSNNQQLAFRIGISLGDVIVDGDDLYGNGVNVAARMEGLAEPGGICISGNVFEHVGTAVDVDFDDLGPQEVKNIAQPVRSYRVRLHESHIASATGVDQPLSLPDKPSIAVLPFENMSGDEEQEYFSDGITEDIITALSRVRRFFVIARNSTFAYKGKSSDIRDVARELGVRYVLEGSVRKASNRIRLTAQLLDGTNGSHLWAERYDRNLEDIFDLQDELTQTIVGAIEPELNKAEQERARLKKPENLGVWDIYQRGMSDLHKLTEQSLPDAETTLLHVTEIDPDFAAAFVGLANVHYYKLVLGFTEDPQTTRREVLAAGRQAVALDHEDADSHCAVGRGYLSNRMFDDAIAEFREALAINPSHALAHYALGATYVFQGQPEQSLPHLENAIRLSPYDANMGSFLVRRAQALLYLHQHEEAVEWARRALRLPNFQWSRYVMLISALAHLGQIKEARSALDELLQRIPNFSAQYALDYSPWLDDEHFRHMINGLHKAGLPE